VAESEGGGEEFLATRRPREHVHAGGFDFSQFTEKDRIIPLYPASGTTAGILAKKSLVETAAYAPGFPEPTAFSRHGNLIQYPAQRVALPLGERGAQRLLEHAARSEVILTPQVLPRGAGLRQAYAAAIASGDPQVIFDGSLLSSSPQDESFRRLQRAW